MSVLNETYVSAALKKAMLAGASALKSQVRAVEADLKKQIEEKSVLAGQGVINMCTQSCEDYMQAADLLEGFVRRHGPPDETRDSR